MTWFLVVLVGLAVIWAADGLRLRRRLRALPRLTPDAPRASGDGLRLVTATDVVVDEATQRAAFAHLRREGLEVLDLVPARLSVWQALFLAQGVPEGFRRQRLARGRSAGHALVVSEELIARAGEPPAQADELSLVAWAVALKRHAATTMDFAVAPALPARAERPERQRGLLSLAFGNLVGFLLVVQAVLVASTLAGLYFAPIAAAAALLAFHLQPLIACAGSAITPPDLGRVVLLRAPLELVGIVRLLAARTPADPEADLQARAETLRDQYAALLAGGTERFFEPRRADCPVCGGPALEVALRTTDLYQKKPGEFVVERCLGCSHMFQNPRLSIAGLDFYYKDFYDGLGEARLEGVFSFHADPYLARARMVLERTAPSSWLDVGTGHAHFCCVARDLAPGTRFDGLDLAASIEEAERRGWVDRAYRGLFPELGPELAAGGARYDVVSMSHYLEHTREPRAEIAAAAQLMDEGAHLFIELPDPECKMHKVLGRLWMPWFQPQHQHFLSIGALERLLVEAGFEVVERHRGEAHQSCDFTFGAMMLLHRLAPPLHYPWLPPPGRIGRLWARAVWSAGVPAIGVAWLLDKGLAFLFRRPGWSNTYRVLARKRVPAATRIAAPMLPPAREPAAACDNVA